MHRLTCGLIPRAVHSNLGTERRGTSVVEFAIVLPCFILLVLGTVDFGRLFWTQGALQYAVDRAARCASVTPSICTASNTPAYAAARTPGISLPASDFAYTTASCGNQISASVPFAFTVPYLFPNSPTLTARSCHPK